MILWLALNSVGLLFLAVVLFLVMRQMGYVLAHAGPLGARGIAQGPRMTENLTHQLTPVLATTPFTNAIPTLVVFASASCPICRVIRKCLEDVAPHWFETAQIVLVYDKLKESGASTLPRNVFAIEYPQGFRDSLAVKSVPYAIMTDAAKMVVGHGLVNNSSHVESLLELCIRRQKN